MLFRMRSFGLELGCRVVVCWVHLWIQIEGLLAKTKLYQCYISYLGQLSKLSKMCVELLSRSSTQCSSLNLPEWDLFFCRQVMGSKSAEGPNLLWHNSPLGGVSTWICWMGDHIVSMLLFSLFQVKYFSSHYHSFSLVSKHKKGVHLYI